MIQRRGTQTQDQTPLLPWRERINGDYLRIFRQVPLMLRLSVDRRHGGMPQAMRRILILNNTLVGEFMVSLPAIRRLLDRSRAIVDLVVSPPVAPLAERMRGIHEVFVARSVYERETENGDEAQRGPAGTYDLVLALQLSRSSFEMLRCLHYRRIRASLGDYVGYTCYVAPRLAQKTGLKQVEDLVFDVIEQPRAGPVVFDDIFRFEKRDLERVAPLPCLRETSGRRVVVHTGSGWSAKLWSAERWASTLRAIDQLGPFQFVLIGGGERELRDCAEIRARVPFEVHSLVGSADLRDVALVMRESDFFLGVDSGPRHIAHLLRLPSVCLLGPGPRIFSPEDRGAQFVDESDCRCTTLLCHRRDLCMGRISVGQVVEAFERALRSQAALGRAAAGAAAAR